ncbi:MULTISPECIES: hypothetical protein [unclassified Glutamicibacter]
MSQEPTRNSITPDGDESPGKGTKNEEEALAREWERESFPASDPPANY